MSVLKMKLIRRFGFWLGYFSMFVMIQDELKRIYLGPSDLRAMSHIR